MGTGLMGNKFDFNEKYLEDESMLLDLGHSLV